MASYLKDHLDLSTLQVKVRVLKEESKISIGAYCIVEDQVMIGKIDSKSKKNDENLQLKFK